MKFISRPGTYYFHIDSVAIWAQAIPSLHLQPFRFRLDLVAFLGHGGVRSLVLRLAKHVSALRAVEVDQANPIRKVVNLLQGMAKQVATGRGQGKGALRGT